MRGTSVGFGSALGLCLLALSVTPPAPAVSPPGGLDIESREQELEGVRARIREVQELLEQAEGERNDLSADLRETEKRIGSIARRLRVLAGRLEGHSRELDALVQERKVRQQQLDLHRETLARQVRAAYAMGRQERLKILLNQQDPAMVSRVMVYYDYFNHARAEQVRTVEDNLTRLAEVEAQIKRQRERVLSLQAKALTQKQALEAARADRAQVLATLNADIKTKGQQLDRLKRDEQNLQALVDRLQKALMELPPETVGRSPFVSRKGRLPWPTSGHLTARFGATRQAGRMRWDGVLIAAPEGGEVRAVYHGRVAFADWLRGYGLLLIIDHGDGYMTLYGHNESLFKETGEWVDAGEAIASVGSSGGRTGAAVYFGIRFRGRPVDPVGWCLPIHNQSVGMTGGPESRLSIPG
jgi:septal ring factor EnvC (AmiA/AmiB activator)